MSNDEQSYTDNEQAKMSIDVGGATWEKYSSPLRIIECNGKPAVQADADEVNHLRSIAAEMAASIECATRYMIDCGYESKRKQADGYQDPDDAMLSDLETVLAKYNLMVRKHGN